MSRSETGAGSVRGSGFVDDAADAAPAGLPWTTRRVAHRAPFAHKVHSPRPLSVNESGSCSALPNICYDQPREFEQRQRMTERQRLALSEPRVPCGA